MYTRLETIEYRRKIICNLKKSPKVLTCCLISPKLRYGEDLMLIFYILLLF